MRTKHLFVGAMVTATLAVTAAGSVIVASERQSGQSARPEALAPLPVRVEVLLTRFQGEKKISSLPFSLLSSANDARGNAWPVSIRMGIDVPIGTTTTTDSRTAPSGGDGTTRATGSTSTKVQYRNVGTDIDCLALRLDETRFSIRVSVSDSSIYSPDSDGKSFKNPDSAAFRTFSTSNTVVMTDGQTVLFGVGTDKVSGETLKIEVTLRVMK